MRNLLTTIPLPQIRPSRFLYVAFAGVLILVMAGAFLVQKKNYQTQCITQESSDNIRGVSMAPLLSDGQKVRSLYGYYSCNPVQGGEVVILAFSTRDDLLIKKVSAVPGDQIVFQGEHALLNGAALVNSAGQKYTFSSVSADILSKQLLNGKVQNDFYLALGEEADLNSLDSRRFGFVSSDHLKGRVLY